MKNKNSKIQQPCFNKFNSDLNKAKMHFSKAFNNYLKSKEHKTMIEAFKKLGAF